MNLTYNGVKLQICHFNDFRQRSVGSEDGADYLFTHFFINVTCIWNPNATASFLPIERRAMKPGDDEDMSNGTTAHRALLDHHRSGC